PRSATSSPHLRAGSAKAYPGDSGMRNRFDRKRSDWPPGRGRQWYTPAMITGTMIAEIAALAGDPARANILSALLDGRAMTATELAYAAHVTPQTASAHLAKLVEAGLISVLPQGRHRYFRLASPKVAQMLESIVSVAVD